MTNDKGQGIQIQQSVVDKQTHQRDTPPYQHKPHVRKVPPMKALRDCVAPEDIEEMADGTICFEAHGHTFRASGELDYLTVEHPTLEFADLYLRGDLFVGKGWAIEYGILGGHAELDGLVPTLPKAIEHMAGRANEAIDYLDEAI